MVGRLTDVAEKVGVSEATVSRVLNGRPGVSEATRKAVLTALDVLGYERPTKLRGERARLVGLVLPELQNPIFPAFADVVGGSLAQQGLTPVLCTHTAGLSEADYVELLFEQHVSGVLFAGGNYSGKNGAHEHYQGLIDRKLPTVLVNAGIDELPFPRVSCDDAVAADQACRHLISLGHTRIGLILGPDDHVPSLRRLEAARRTLEGAGLELGRDQVEFTRHSLEGGQAAAARLLSRGITGVVCGSDPTALGAIRATKRAGLSVPHGPVGRRLRRLGVHELHRAAAHHGPPADRGDGPGRGRPARGPHRRASTSGPTSCCSSPSWSCAGSTGPVPLARP